MEIKPAKRVGRIIELLRNEVGLSLQEVAAQANVHKSTVSHIENGTKGAHIDTVRAIGKAINHEEVAVEAYGFVHDLGFTAVAEILAAYEKEASRICISTTTVFHPLLHTEAYARAILEGALPFTSEAEREERLLKLNERRQAIQRDDPPFVWAVVDESTLYRPHGGDEVMRDQLLHIEELAKLPYVVVQVLPLKAVKHPAFEGTLGIIEFADKTPIWYSDAWGAGSLSDDSAEVMTKLKFFDVIRGAAMGQAESVDFIGRARRKHYEHD